MYYKLALHTMESFIKYSEKIGNNFLLCQGPGGNTSVKSKKDIYIKKSGHLLSNSSLGETFKKVNLTDINSFYTENLNDKKFDKELSIETPLHVLLRSKYVFHYHSIASILISAIYEKDILNRFLLNNSILPINYIRPGYELATEIVSRKYEYKCEAFFLYNHGVVVEGQNIKKVYETIKLIENLFSELIDYEELKKITRIVIHTKLSDYKFNNPNSKIDYSNFKDRYLFPDHSVFFPNSFSFDEKYIYLEKKLNNTELQYFQTLLILYNLIGEEKILNFINKDTGEKLRKSEDEQLRLRINK
jgi:rhamnose utilization protein RhaD (predicted bifunctional aldolase and dehydrogenase)